MGNSIKAVDGFHHIQALFNKIYCGCSYFATLQCELLQIASELKMEIKKIGKVFHERWIASSRRIALAHNHATLYQHFKQLSKSS